MPSKKLRVAQNLNDQLLSNTRFPNIAGDASSPSEGEYWLNTSTNVAKIRNNGSDKVIGQVDSITAASTKITVAGTASAPTVDVAVANLIDDTQSTSTNIYSASKVNSQITSAISGFSSGVDWKDSVRMATTSNVASLTVATVANIDGSSQGVTLVEGNRVLLAAQTDASENGIYVVGSVAGGVAALTRAADANADSDVTNGMACTVSEGSKANYLARLTTSDPIVLDSTDLTFTIDPVTVIAGSGLSQSGATLSVNVDDSSLEINSDTLRVKANGITNAMLSTITAANKVSGSAIQLASTPGLEDSTGLQIKIDATGGANLALAVNKSSNGLALKIDDSTISSNGSNQLIVKSGGIAATQLASNAVTTVKITDANVTYAKLAADAKPYVGTFATTDFSSGVYTLTAATHGLGADVKVTVQEDDGTNWVEVTDSVVVYSIKASGNVKVEVTSGQEFNGRVIVEKAA